MKLPKSLKTVAGAIVFVALFAGYYTYEHRSHPAAEEPPMQAQVLVTKAAVAQIEELLK